jgi:serine protease Do
MNMQKNRILSALTVALAASLLTPPAHAAVEAPATPAVQAAQAGTLAQRGLPDFADLVERVGSAVVNISVEQAPEVNEGESNPFNSNDPLLNDFLRRFGIPQMPGMPGAPGTPRGGRHGIGSGFIVSHDGYVLTNAHVVGDGGDKTELTVRLSDKREFRARVIGTDRRTDVAVLKIDATSLPTVTIGDAGHARVGEWVVAVGSPFGFEHSVTAGIISAKARRLPEENYVPFLQTDVAINPGNSGGPLFDLNGRVIGINSQIYSRSGGFMGISFAIPIDVAMKVKDQLVQHGRVQRGRLGIYIQGVNQDLASSFGLAESRGALVARVEPGSAAERAGLKAGDVVLAVNGAEFGESAELPRIIGDLSPGSRVKLDTWRDGKHREVVAVLDDLNADSDADDNGHRPAINRNPDDAAKNRLAELGIGVRPLTARESSRLGVASGLVIESVNGQTTHADLQTGDILLALNNQPVGTLAQFRQQLAQAGKRFALLVQRGEARLFVAVKLD